MTSLGPIRTGLSASGRGSPAATGHTPTDFSHETLTGCDPRARAPADNPRKPFSQRRSRARMQPRRSRRRSRARIERPADLTGNSRRAHLIRLAMDLRGGHAPSVHAAAIEISRLAVAAEGPGAPFTATHRGQQLLRLIHIVVQNVGLEDKVGALTALRLLKADDTLLQKLLKAGVLPSLLGIIRADATAAATDADADGDGAAAEAARAEATAAAARAVQAFSSSGDALTTLLRGGAVEVLSAYACRRGGEVADPIRSESKPAPPGDGSGTPDVAAKHRASAAKSCVVAMARVSGSYLTDLDEHAAFERDAGQSPDAPGSIESALDPAAATSALSVARSLLALLESDLVVSHGEACVGLERLAASGRAGRAAACQVGCVLPLMAAALAGNPKQRGLAMEALEALTIGNRDNSPGERTRAAAAAARGADDVVGGASDAPMDADDDDAAAGGGGVGDPREIAARAQAQITATHRTTPGVKRGRVQTAGYTDLSATTLGVIGTAAKVGETFFGGLIAILGEILSLRGPLERAAADAALALWALAWQPSNRAAAVPVVTAPLAKLYEEGRDAAADDAGATLSVLVRNDADAREIIRAMGPHGADLVAYLLESGEANEGEGPSPKARGGAADNFFKRMAEGGIGPSRLGGGTASASPGLARCISGRYD